MFIDRVQIEVQAGNGGDGACSFRREKYVPHGGPDGGDGGDGGSILVIAKPGVDSLSMLAHKKIWRAGRGDHGSGSNRSGRKAEDMIIDVPPGTVVPTAGAMDGSRKSTSTRSSLRRGNPSPWMP